MQLAGDSVYFDYLQKHAYRLMESWRGVGLLIILTIRTRHASKINAALRRHLIVPLADCIRPVLLHHFVVDT